MTLSVPMRVFIHHNVLSYQQMLFYVIHWAVLFFIFNESSASDVGLKNVIHFDGVFA